MPGHVCMLCFQSHIPLQLLEIFKRETGAGEGGAEASGPEPVKSERAAPQVDPPVTEEKKRKKKKHKKHREEGAE
jgi:hypothetical protein